MIGAIRRRDVIAHPIVTVRCFGWPIFLKALFSRHAGTFLELLQSNRVFDDQTAQMPASVRRCIELELRLKHIYSTLSHQPAAPPRHREFLTGLARQEQDHADLLRTALVASQEVHWLESTLSSWQASIARLEQQIGHIESAVSSDVPPPEMLDIVARIETSEINRLFQALIDASPSPFVRRLGAFQTAITSHISYIVERLAEFGATLSQRNGRSQPQPETTPSSPTA